MNSKYSIKSFIVFWGLIFSATALFFSIVVTQVFFDSYILNSSFKELKTLSTSLSTEIKTEVSAFEALQADKIQSNYFIKAVINKQYEALRKLFINWQEAHRIKDIFLYSPKGVLIDLKSGLESQDKVSLSKQHYNYLRSGNLKSYCELSKRGILIDTSRQIKDYEADVLIGFLSQRKEILYSDLKKKLDDVILVAATNKEIYHNSLSLSKSEKTSTAPAFLNQKLDQFVLTINAEKYDFIKNSSCGDFNIFVGKKNLQQEIYFSFYKKFFPFLVAFLILTAVMFAFSFYKQVLKPLSELNRKIESKEEIDIATNISEIESISRIVSKEISGLEEKVEKTHEGRKKDMTRLVASVAHELNNSLSYLGGNLEYIKSELSEEEIDKKEAREAIQSAQQGYEEIKKIVSDLKVFSSVGSLMKTKFSLDKIKKRILAKYDLVQFKGFEDSQGIESDFERVLQIIMNLIQNAITACKDSSPEVKVSFEKKDGDVYFYVSDQSGGISSKIKDQIFDPFFTTKKTEGGTGLGLSLSKNLAESLGGELILADTNSKGSKFCLILRNSAKS